jgi:hydrogenase expression/formation protein HypE
MLPFGKIPPEILEQTVFRNTGTKREDVILGATRGEDAAIVRVGDRLLVLKCDPISGAVERIGWLAVNVVTNDIATRGVRPNWILSCIMLPEGSGEAVLKTISQQMHRAATELGVAIVGGHSEITPGLNHPLVISSAIGIVQGERYVTCANAKPGNTVILTKGAGIEGTAILASDRGMMLEKVFGKAFLGKAQEYFNEISVVKEALTAFNYGGVSAMHDPTEGGVAGGIHELCDASHTGFRIYEDKIIIRQETSEICSFFKINPLNLIGSGALLIVVDNAKADGIVKQLGRERIRSSIIGEIVEKKEGRMIIKKDGLEEILPRPRSDDLWVALSR